MNRLLIILLLLLPLLGCSSSPSVFDPPEALRSFAPEYDVARVWNRQIGRGSGDRYPGLPLLYDGRTLFVADVRGSLSAVRAESGELLWERRLDLAVRGGPGDGGEYLLLGGDATVIALAKEDGRTLWQAPVSSEVLAAPVRAGEVVIARSVDGYVHGLSALDGRRLWQTESSVPLLSLRGEARPVVADGSVIVGHANGRVAAFSLHSGALLWETPLAVPRGRTELERMVDVDGGLTIQDGSVFAGAYQGRMAALSLASGRLLWSRELSSYTGTVVDGNNRLFTTDTAGEVWALATDSGATLWRQDATRGRWPAAPSVQGDAIVVGDYAGYLHWFATEDGRPLARMRVEPPLFDFPVAYEEPAPTRDPLEGRGLVTPPVIDGNRVYAINRHGVVNAFEVTVREHR